MNSFIDEDNGCDCNSPKHMGCSKCDFSDEKMYKCDFCGEEILIEFKPKGAKSNICPECLEIENEIYEEKAEILKSQINED